MINVFIDIETLPDQRDGAKDSIKITAPAQYKKPESIQKWIDENGESARDEQWRKTALNGGYGSICVACIAIEGGDIAKFALNDNVIEADLLQEVWGFIGDQVGGNQWRFVAHNAKFDVPFIWHRSVVNKIKPLFFNPHGRHGQHHYCTMEAWAGFGKFIKMDELASILSIAWIVTPAPLVIIKVLFDLTRP